MTRGKVLKLLCTKLNIKMPLPHLKAPDVSGCSGSLLVVKWGSGGRASEPLADCWWFAGSPTQHTSSFHGEKVRLDSQRQQNRPYPLLTVRGPFRRLRLGSRVWERTVRGARSGGAGVRRTTTGSCPVVTAHGTSAAPLLVLAVLSVHRPCVGSQTQADGDSGGVHMPPSNFRVLSRLRFSPDLSTFAHSHLCSSV